jgi:nitroreductase
MKFEKSVLEIIKERQSRRNFVNIDLPADHLKKINDILRYYTTGPFGNHVAFSLIEKKFAEVNHKVKLGTYGFITGAHYFIAGKVTDGDYANEDYGYLLESIILHLTSMDLGTCWLGGTFKRSDFFEILKSDANQVIPAITPVGIPSESRSVKENVIRWGAGSDNRKKPVELFITDSDQLSQEIAGLYELPLEMVRLAPSASNKQPWRIRISPGVLNFYLKRTPGYKKVSSRVDLQKTDMGIAMSHFELACRELKLKGEWSIGNGGSAASESGEYLVSWKL